MVILLAPLVWHLRFQKRPRERNFCPQSSVKTTIVFYPCARSVDHFPRCAPSLAPLLALCVYVDGGVGPCCSSQRVVAFGVCAAPLLCVHWCGWGSPGGVELFRGPKARVRLASVSPFPFIRVMPERAIACVWMRVWGPMWVMVPLSFCAALHTICARRLQIRLDWRTPPRRKGSAWFAGGQPTGATNPTSARRSYVF